MIWLVSCKKFVGFVKSILQHESVFSFWKAEQPCCRKIEAHWNWFLYSSFSFSFHSFWCISKNWNTSFRFNLVLYSREASWRVVNQLRLTSSVFKVEGVNRVQNQGEHFIRVLTYFEAAEIHDVLKDFTLIFMFEILNHHVVAVEHRRSRNTIYWNELLFNNGQCIVRYSKSAALGLLKKSPHNAILVEMESEIELWRNFIGRIWTGEV